MDELVTVSSDVIFRKNDYDLMVLKIRDTIIQNGRISLAEARDLFNTSRKYVQAVLEHLDAIGITVRDGDFRKLKKQSILSKHYSPLQTSRMTSKHSKLIA